MPLPPPTCSAGRLSNYSVNKWGIFRHPIFLIFYIHDLDEEKWNLTQLDCLILNLGIFSGTIYIYEEETRCESPRPSLATHFNLQTFERITNKITEMH